MRKRTGGGNAVAAKASESRSRPSRTGQASSLKTTAAARTGGSRGFDTLQASKALREAGVPEEQAEAIVEMTETAVHDAVATKADLIVLETRMESDNRALRDRMDSDNQALRDKIDSDNQALRDKIDSGNQALRDKMESDNQALRGKMDADNQALRDKMDADNQALRDTLREGNRADLAQTETRILKWLVGTMLIIAGLVIAAMKL